MMPELTPEQKEHLKIARRANLRIEETWTLFNLYLAHGDTAVQALALARRAVDVWAEFMDANEVEGPDIKMPDFVEQMGRAAQVFSANLRPPGVEPLAVLPESPEPKGQHGPTE